MSKTSRTRSGWTAKWSGWIAACMGFVGATALFLWPLPARFGREIAGSPGDNLIFYWNLWWFREALWKLHQTPFRTALLFHPDGANLAYHTTTPFATIPGSLLALIVPLPVAFNLVFVGCFLLAAIAIYGLALHVAGRAGIAPPSRRALAFFAAIAWSFAPFHMAHIGHLNILNVGAVPLAAWMLLRFVELPSTRRALAFGAALGCCTLADGYHVLAAILLALLLAWLVRAPAKAGASGATTGSPRSSRGLRHLAIATAAFLFVSSPVLVPMMFYGSRGLEDVRAGGANEYVADAVSYVLPSPFHPLWGSALQKAYGGLTGNQAENVVFPTFTVLALALYGWKRGGREARRWGWIGVAFAVLSLGPFLHVAGRDGIPIGDDRILRLPLPKLILDSLPLVSGARAAGRFASVGQLGLVLCAMLGLARFAQRREGGVRRSVWAAALALVAFESLAAPIRTTRIEIPEAYRALVADSRARGARGVVLEVPPVHSEDKRYQLYQTVHGLPLLGGRLARAPVHAYDRLHRDPFLDRLISTDPWRAKDGLLSLDGLDSLNVEYVVLHTGHTAAGAIARVLEHRFEPIPTPGEARLFRRRPHGSDSHQRP